ncbi:FHA domain-containing protein [Luteimonas sp. RD2P54]|uniref:FHA domain-containing protein n=1 Tax=Luteimonas endophytica TaxID=3042023 RepID=A0ABT6J3V6_9GAMM|nr:FHA domain-containing protein [Luteimonas endophytica]MDH5821506.1 FHA domain-containing protein [Luteimonas endophytica]
MEVLKLRFTSAARPDLPLGVGMHGIGRARSRGELDVVGNGQPAVVRFCVDRRGVWLTVAEGERGVHVNGREIRRLAMLRIGDTVYVDGIEMRLVGERRQAAPAGAPAPEPDPDPRVVLRGVGGQHHGRSFTLERPRTVGRAAESDIRIDDAAFAERHARLELGEGCVLLRDLGSDEGSVVNGESVRDAVLLPGDQVVFDSHHRFVVEAPVRAFAGQEPIADAVARSDAAAPAPVRAGSEARRAWRLPWLLLAALALAALLSLLLLYGSG